MVIHGAIPEVVVVDDQKVAPGDDGAFVLTNAGTGFLLQFDL